MIEIYPGSFKANSTITIIAEFFVVCFLSLRRRIEFFDMNLFFQSDLTQKRQEIPNPKASMTMFLPGSHFFLLFSLIILL